MKTEPTVNYENHFFQYQENLYSEDILSHKLTPKNEKSTFEIETYRNISLPQILFITSYPPRECGIATYSQDLVNSLKNKFRNSFHIRICAVLSEHEVHTYNKDVEYSLNTLDPASFLSLRKVINKDENIKLIVIQHEFGLFKRNEEAFHELLQAVAPPVITAFHTVLPRPSEEMIKKVEKVVAASATVIAMTQNSASLLHEDYNIPKNKIKVIPHGTHLVPYLDKAILKEKYKLSGKRILSTFGLLSAGKSIETTLDAMPDIIKNNPDVVFLVLGKTHPAVVKYEGENYRRMLEVKVKKLNLENHVFFINKYIPLHELLEYLQLTDLYLFTSRDPNQAVSGTFSYAISCGCAIISTPIPHALEFLRDDVGMFFEFGNSEQLSQAVNKLLSDNNLRKAYSLNGMHRIAPTSWENSAVAHAELIRVVSNSNLPLQYTLPEIKLNHLKKLTTDFGILQFSRINQPDPDSGYTLDDNARALIVICQHFVLTKDNRDLKYINIYFQFIKHCLLPEKYFLNYVDHEGLFTDQNNVINLADANGRAIWALGYLISLDSSLPRDLISKAVIIFKEVLPHLKSIHSTRAMAFVIKGLYYANLQMKSKDVTALLTVLANRLVQMYKHESNNEWIWFESYLTYANGVLPEAMLCAYLATQDQSYKAIARLTFSFLLKRIFIGNNIKVISNRSWLYKGEKPDNFGEQPIDVAYSILALDKFYAEFNDKNYLNKMIVAFNWFLGNNHLHQTIYNPCTGGCYDGLEENHVNLNQGAESTLSYLMARLTVEQHKQHLNKIASYQEHEMASA